MKQCLFLCLTLLPQLALAELASKYGDCSSDLACEMVKEAKLKEQKEDLQRAELRNYQNQQLQLEQQQVEEVQDQNTILEEQLEQSKPQTETTKSEE